MPRPPPRSAGEDPDRWALLRRVLVPILPVCTLCQGRRGLRAPSQRTGPIASPPTIPCPSPQEEAQASHTWAHLQPGHLEEEAARQPGSAESSLPPGAVSSVLFQSVLPGRQVGGQPGVEESPGVGAVTGPGTVPGPGRGAPGKRLRSSQSGGAQGHLHSRCVPCAQVREGGRQPRRWQMGRRALRHRGRCPCSSGSGRPLCAGTVVGGWSWRRRR